MADRRHRIYAAFLLALTMLLTAETVLAETADADRPTLTYRALLIGQSYLESGNAAPMLSAGRDVLRMDGMLKAMTASAYRTTVLTDLPADGIGRAVADAFGEARPEDVSLLYYAGHGLDTGDRETRGALLGTDGRALTLRELCLLLDRLPGVKIVLLDSCCSGNIVPILTEMRARGQARNIFALCAADSFEQTVTVTGDPKEIGSGLFTDAILTGSGWAHEEVSGLPADRNGDNAVSLMEAYYFTRDYVNSGVYAQHPTVWPRTDEIILWGLSE